MTEPRVSVVVPTYNRAALLPDTLRSILAQTVREIEVLVVDNQSPYDLESLIRGLNDPRLRLFRFSNGGFIGAGRNHGLDHARAPLTAFCDDDDLWLPEKLEKQLAAYDPARHAGVATASVCEDVPAGRDRSWNYPRAEATFEDLLLSGPPAISSLVARTADVRFPVDPAIQHVEDWDLMLRLTAEGKPLRVLPEPLLRYRIHGTNEGQELGKTANALNVIERHRSRMSDDLYRRARARLYFVFGSMALERRLPGAARYFRDSYRARPSLRAATGWAVGLLPAAARRGAVRAYRLFTGWIPAARVFAARREN